LISSSKFDLQSVFDTIVTAAARLCEADMASVTQPTGPDGAHEHVASVGFRTDFLRVVRNFPIAVGRGTLVGRTLFERRTVHIPDVLRDREYIYPALQKAAGYRTMLGVPLMRDGTPIGVIFLARRKPRKFNQRQIQLVTTFADQAVIAIENARLFNELEIKSRQLELANTFKSRFLAAASHDLRQPLHALNLFAAQLNEPADAEEQRQLFDQIHHSIGSMNELFEALLDMSKLDAGVLEPHLSEFSIAILLERIRTTFARSAQQKELRFKVVTTKAWVRSDFILLERILLNLVSNAVRYTMHGGILIGCRRQGALLRIEVCDSGVGIPEDQQRNVFGEFYQLPSHQMSPRSGLGLGLAIVERLANLLGHPLGLSSCLGVGSRFTVSVPLTGPRADLSESPRASSLDPLDGRVIVVIDDDAAVVEGMRSILSSWGCGVIAADSEKSAVTAVAGRSFDLIISDYRLTDSRTGMEAIERLREVAGASVPALLVSGDTAPDRLREARARGYLMLHKPVPPIRLRAAISNLLKKPRPHKNH
jgi:signal transduction histidine kinase